MEGAEGPQGGTQNHGIGRASLPVDAALLPLALLVLQQGQRWSVSADISGLADTALAL